MVMDLRTNLDFQAPQISVNSDMFRNLLKKCLTTGGGAQWVLEYESSTTSVFRTMSTAQILRLVVEETLDKIYLKGWLSDEEYPDFTFAHKYLEKLFPTYYQEQRGFVISKTNLSIDWAFLKGADYFYFYSGQFVIFFGKLESKDNSYSLVASNTFGSTTVNTGDHYYCKKGNTFTCRLVGKIASYSYECGENFSFVYVYDSLANKIVGSFPNLYVSNLGFDNALSDTTLGKKLLIKNLNNKTMMFDLNG